MKKLFPLFIIVILMLMVSSVFADDLSDVKQAGVLRFGAPLEFVPFVFEDDSGNSTGIDIALMEEVCKRMGVRLQKTSFARDGIIDALNLGQTDVIGGGLSKTDSRAQRIDFTRTYYNGEAQIIALASLSKPQVVNLDSFRGMKFGVVKGSSFQEWVQENLVDKSYIPQSNVYTYSDISDGMKALDRKDVDLVITDQDVYEDRYRATGKYQLFYSGFQTENYAFGVRQGSTLRDEINNHLNDMIKDGTAQSIANRFFSMDFSQKYQDSINRPAATLVPVVSQVPAATNCVNGMSYVADVTIKDGQVFNPGSGFRKTWRVYNNGSCTWDSNYYLDFAGGDRMNGSSVRVPGTVKPGQTVDISIDMTAPNNAGKYKGNWQMRSPQGAGFGQTIWVSITVNGNAPVKPTAKPQDGQVRTIPVINSFYADSNSGYTGDGTTIHWSTTKASGVTIYVDSYMITNASASGSYQLQAPLQGAGTHEIRLVAHSVTDDATSSIYYTMKDRNGGSGNDGQTRTVPQIDYFYADSTSGYSGDGTTVYWSTTNASGVTLSVDGYDLGSNSASGSYQLQAPLQGAGTHTITLTAHSVTDSVSSSITYTMKDRNDSSSGNDGQTQVIPQIDYFYADSYSGYSGDGTTVYWSTTNAGGVTLSVDGYDLGSNSASGSYQLQAPLQGAGTHTITLTAHSVTDSVSSSITYTMNDRQEPTLEPTQAPVLQPTQEIIDWTDQQWQEFENTIDNMTDEDWNNVIDNMTDEDWNNVIDNMTEDDWDYFFNNLSEEDLQFLVDEDNW